ncbi:putative predicted 76.3Kd protein [Streptomyces sp. Tu6071]|nr:putative predicted 76.3Kd protein [Streptomyces sp. Tu6071]
MVDGNLALVEPRYVYEGEREDLISMMTDFKILPAGRHLKSSGVSDFALNNCWAAGWNPNIPAEHFTFTLLRLAEGGGVGANYSKKYFKGFPLIGPPVQVHIVCDPSHPDYEELSTVISHKYDHKSPYAYEVEDSREGWARALEDLIGTAHEPGEGSRDRIYDVSQVRAKGSPLESFGGTASGPLPFALMLVEIGEILSEEEGEPLNGTAAMEIDHAIAKCIISGGVRRSARMSIMHWADPRIGEFMRLKKYGGHWTTNISVEIDNEFLAQVAERDSWARFVFQRITEGMLRNGEPGVWNSSLSAEGEVDGVYTTNPCGEATLTPWEPCNLGSVNLGAFVSPGGSVDRTGLLQAHALMTRYLLRATFASVSDFRSRKAISRYRRIGVGHFGFADYLAKRGIKYSDAWCNTSVILELEELAHAVDEVAIEYANALRIAVPIKKRVIAPTGTISKLAGVSGEGIHAPFADYFIRRIRFSSLEPAEASKIEEYRAAGYLVEPDKVAANTMVVAIPTKDPLVDLVQDAGMIEHAGMLQVTDMLRVQELYQSAWADQAVSYTANVDPKEYTPESLQNCLRDYLFHLKGTTVFPEMSFEQPPYERITKEEYERLTRKIGTETSDTSYDEVCASGACPI